MINKRKRKIIILRLIAWVFYFIAGYLVYVNKFAFPSILMPLCKFIYPLSIFWLQIRFHNKENWLPINASMTTSQLWFRLIPVFLSFFVSIIVFINMLIVIF